MNLNFSSDGVISNLEAYHNFLNQLRALGTPVKFQKNDVVFREGGKADFVIFIEEGILRTYRLVNDKEVVLGFTFPGDIDTSPISFISQEACTETIDAVCDIRGYKISRSNFFNELESVKAHNDVLQTLLLRYIDTLIVRHLDSKAYTAEENYLKLLMSQPKLINNIPLKDVASFLGISKERLSRIRKKHELT